VDEPIVADVSLLSAMAPGGHLFLGRATPELREAAEASGVELLEYDADKELMLLRAPAIVEGAIRLAIEHTDVTIHDAKVVVVGYGTIGSLLARRLRDLGARLHVAARNPIQRAAAHADGARAHALEELPDLAPQLQMVFSTVPARVVDRAMLERLPPRSLVLDIAPPPDHADLDAAAELGHAAVWARGLGRRAPITVGASQWMGLRRAIEEIERARAGGAPANLDGAVSR
jgi:dipicolinate synthase subunit A